MVLYLFVGYSSFCFVLLLFDCVVVGLRVCLFCGDCRLCCLWLLFGGCIVVIHY